MVFQQPLPRDFEVALRPFGSGPHRRQRREWLRPRAKQCLALRVVALDPLPARPHPGNQESLIHIHLAERRLTQFSQPRPLHLPESGQQIIDKSVERRVLDGARPFNFPKRPVMVGVHLEMIAAVENERRSRWPGCRHLVTEEIQQVLFRADRVKIHPRLLRMADLVRIVTIPALSKTIRGQRDLVRSQPVKPRVPGERRAAPHERRPDPEPAQDLRKLRAVAKQIAHEARAGRLSPEPLHHVAPLAQIPDQRLPGYQKLVGHHIPRACHQLPLAQQPPHVPLPLGTDLQVILQNHRLPVARERPAQLAGLQPPENPVQQPHQPRPVILERLIPLPVPVRT